VPVDTTIDFEVIPFVMGEDDTLTFDWWLDGELMEFDTTRSAISIEFGELGEHEVMCVLADTVDTDTVTWQIDVYHPEDVSTPSDATLPQEIALYPPSPNPFNAKASIRYDLPAAGHILLAVYDINGRQVDVLVNGEMPAGRHIAELNASGLAAGVYFVLLETRLASKSGHPLLRRGGDSTVTWGHVTAQLQKAVVVK